MDWDLQLHLVAVQVTFYDSWHNLGWPNIPLAPLSLVGFYMEPTKSLTFSRGPKGCQVTLGDMNI